MKDLKEILFENMYHLHKLAYNKELRAKTNESYMEEAVVLYGVIREAGLAEEYAKYFASKECERHKNAGVPLIHNNSDHIRVAGHRGTWYVIDEMEVNGEKFFLLEHETWGDEAASVVVNQHGELVEEDVWNGFDDCVLQAIYEYFGMKEDD